MYAQNVGEKITIEELIDLSGKRALVTGGLKGIGKSIASRLSECGATVLVAGSAIFTGNNYKKNIMELKKSF